MTRKSKSANNVVRRQQIANEVSRMINRRAEHKVWSTVTTSGTTATAGVVINLSNNIVQGDNFDNRSGDTIRVISQKHVVEFQAVTNDSFNRYILFRDMFNAGTTPTVTQVLTSASFISGYNGLTVRQQRRFVILKDWSSVNNINGQTMTVATVQNRTPMNIYYNGAAAVASANGRGALFVLIIGSGSTATYNLGTEIVYTDS